MEVGISHLIRDSKIKELWNINELKSFQELAIRSIVIDKKDTVICVPTGGGKSMCFEALTTVSSILSESSVSTATTATSSRPTTSYHGYVRPNSDTNIVLVVSPLVFLMNHQAEKLNERGIHALSLGKGPLTEEEMKLLQSGDFRYVFGNPEHYLQNKFIRGIMELPVYRQQVMALVFDEVHTAVSWGLSKDGAAAFRRYFASVGDLRALYPKVPMLCLTATATKATLEKIKSLLCLKDPVVHRESPDRKNIRVFVKKVTKGTDCMLWLIDELMQKGENMERTIVYCRRFKDCSDLYREFSLALGANSFNLSDRLYDMVHSKTPQNIKEQVTNSLMNPAAKLRVLIATKVVGMGLDVTCQQVVHFGPPQTVEDYLQQLGRAGRDASQAHAILLYSYNQLRNVDASMVRVLKSETHCLRQLALEPFGEKVNMPEPKHWCCNICTTKCNCGICEESCNMYEKNCTREPSDVTSATEQFKRTISEETVTVIKMELFNLKDILDKDASMEKPLYFLPEISHGLTFQVIDSVLKCAESVFSVDDLINKCAVYNYSTAVKIFEIFNILFKDMDPEVELDDDIALTSN